MASSIGDLALRAAGLGVLTGLRSMAGPAFFSYIAGRRPQDLDGTPFRRLVTPEGLLLISLMSIGEAGIDKLPLLPARTALAPLSVRVALGALVGAGTFAAGKQSTLAGAAIGGAAAFVGAHLGYNYRVRLHDKLGLPDFILALGEDAAVFAIGRGLALEPGD